MVLMLIAAALVLLIAYYQISQGLFSALIMAVLTVLCATLAFNYYEVLADAVLHETQPDVAEAASLLALFILPLLILRLIADKLIPANVVLGLWANRIGGGAMGLFTGIILVGVMTIVVQMLPLGESVFTYRSHDATLHRDQRLYPFYPDEFTLGMVNLLSKTAMGAGKTFTDTHDDLLLEAFCARNTAGKNGDLVAFGDDLTLGGVFVPQEEDIPKEVKFPASYPLLLDESVTTKVVIVRATVKNSNTKIPWFRLPATHFRLVSKPARSATESEQQGRLRQVSRSYYPVAFLTARLRDRKEDTMSREAPWQCHTPELVEDTNSPMLGDLSVERLKQYVPGGNITIDWVYRIPVDEDPDAVVFRRAARQDIKRSHGSQVNAGWPSKTGALDRLAEQVGYRR